MRHTHIRTRTHGHTHTYTHAYTHTYTHTRTHTHTHTHTHTYLQALKPEHFGAVTTELFGPFQVIRQSTSVVSLKSDSRK